MNKMFRLILVVLMLVSLGLAGGCGTQDAGPEPSVEDTYVFKFAHEEAPDSVQDLYTRKFAEILHEKSGGRIDIEIFTIGQLGTDMDILELLETGALDFAISSPGTTGTLIPEAQFVNLHFLFSNNMEVNKKVLNTSKAFSEKLAAVYEAKGIKPLAFWTEGFMDWTSNRPLTKISDFQGFKMRTMQAPLIVSSYQAYGANPTPVPFSEVYSSLQLNMIEGQENPIFYVQHNNLHEVQKYLTLSHHALYVTATVVNLEKFNSLPQDIQQMILDTVDEMREHSFKIQQDFNDQALKNMQNTSEIELLELTPEAREEFRQASMPVRDQYIEDVGEIGREILEILVQDIEAAEKELQ